MEPKDPAQRRALPRPVEALVMDFDGVHTDGSVLVDQDGRESVRCDRRDGMGLELLRKAGVKLLVLSKEPNPVVLARCRKLKLECVHGLDDKLPTLERWTKDNAIRREHLVYIGDDVNDIECLSWSACGVVPADAQARALRVADVVLSAGGGRGALRELAELILAG